MCGCPAGRGPNGSCKHIAALCYALEEFSRLKTSKAYVVCTSKLQTWNQPRNEFLTQKMWTTSNLSSWSMERCTNGSMFNQPMILAHHICSIHQKKSFMDYAAHCTHLISPVLCYMCTPQALLLHYPHPLLYPYHQYHAQQGKRLTYDLGYLIIH